MHGWQTLQIRPSKKRSDLLEELHFSEEDDDNEIQGILDIVWVIVRDALKDDARLKAQLENRNGGMPRGRTIDSLRAMSTNSDTQGSKAWKDLFEDGTSYSLGTIILILFSV